MFVYDSSACIHKPISMSVMPVLAVLEHMLSNLQSTYTVSSYNTPDPSLLRMTVAMIETPDMTDTLEKTVQAMHIALEQAGVKKHELVYVSAQYSTENDTPCYFVNLYVPRS